MIDTWLQKISGAVLLFIGLAAALAFEEIAKLFFFISPDGDIGASTLLELRIVLASLGGIGLYLLFNESAHRLLKSAHLRMHRLSTFQFVTMALAPHSKSNKSLPVHNRP